jgi:uncharacterized membrane protein
MPHRFSSMSCLLMGFICLALQDSEHISCQAFAPTVTTMSFLRTNQVRHTTSTTTTPLSMHQRPTQRPQILLFEVNPNQVNNNNNNNNNNSLRRKVWMTLKRCLGILCLTGSIWFGTGRHQHRPWLQPQSAFAVSGGRMGGTFTRSSTSPSSSSSRSSRSSSSSYSNRAYSNSYRLSTPRYNYRSNFIVKPTTAAGPRMSTKNVIFFAGLGLILYHDFQKQKQQQQTSVISLTACLAIPDATNPDSFVNRLNVLSNSVDTTTRKGVQNLVSNVALQLLRQESSIVSALTTSSTFFNDNLAQQAFYQISTTERAKLDSETIHKFGTPSPTSSHDIHTNNIDSPIIITNHNDNSNNNKDVGKATYAVVTITVLWAAQGIRIPSITSREALKDALQIMTSSFQIEDDSSLLGGEVLWVPTGLNETLTMEHIYANYPSLFPL